jgi:hypothetical protein
VSRERVKNQRPGASEHAVGVAKSKQSPDTAAFSSFASNLNGQLDRRFQVLLIAPAHALAN